MNELDFLLLIIIVAGAVIGLRRGLIRVLISIVGIYLVVLVAGYAYKPIGDILSGGLDRLSIGFGKIPAHNLVYVVIVVGMTVAVELVSRAVFEETRLRSISSLDGLLGAVVGLFYGALLASLFLVPSQYGMAQSGGGWSTAINGSALVPTLNRVFRDTVLDVVSILFVNGTPELFLNSVSQRVSSLLLNPAWFGWLTL